jgi:hypothetical protein
MAKLTFVLGLAGSGKSVYAEERSKTTGAEVFEGIVHHGSLPTVVQRLKNGKDCIVEEIAYCESTAREKVVTDVCSQTPGVEIEFICFENDLESANWNVRRRTNKGDVDSHLALNSWWHPRYTCPERSTVLPITRILQDDATA